MVGTAGPDTLPVSTSCGNVWGLAMHGIFLHFMWQCVRIGNAWNIASLRVAMRADWHCMECCFTSAGLQQYTGLAAPRRSGPPLQCAAPQLASSLFYERV
jgi:hypothetical protein